ncbi:MAG: protein kinase, partial [Myxococcota bacterium]
PAAPLIELRVHLRYRSWRICDGGFMGVSPHALKTMSRTIETSVLCRACGHAEASGTAGTRCSKCFRAVFVAESVVAKAKNDPLLGVVVGGKYGIINVLGVGGFGSVYEAIQEPVLRHVALKIVHQRHLSDDHLRQRFFREAKVVAQLTDPTVVTLYDYGEETDHGLYMVFELVRGQTVHQIIKSGPQNPFWTAHIMLQLLGALDEAHRMGMVHRDIKPGNVMVVEDVQGRQRARLLDFGIAKVIATEDGESSLETKEGLVLGTPRYMSPEQARGRGDVDARSDLYSLAVLGYAMLAGKNPFERPSVIETIMAHVQTPPPPLDPKLGVPPAFESVLQQALLKNPRARFQTAAEMMQAIHEVFDPTATIGVQARGEVDTSSARGFGSAVSGLATPTPRPAFDSSARHAVHASQSVVPSLHSPSTPRPFAGPESGAEAELTQASTPSGDVSSALASADTPSRAPLYAAVILFILLLVAVGLLVRQNTSTRAPVKVVKPAPLPSPTLSPPQIKKPAVKSAEQTVVEPTESKKPSSDQRDPRAPSGKVEASGPRALNVPPDEDRASEPSPADDRALNVPPDGRASKEGRASKPSPAEDRALSVPPNDRPTEKMGADSPPDKSKPASPPPKAPAKTLDVPEF